jgi:hypothetical protein
MATRYWVGGSGTWDASSTSNWSATTGGASGASAPVAADTVIFDSGSGTGTCTTASGAVCSAVTLNSATVGLTLGANLTMAASFSFTQGTLSLGSSTLSCLSFVSSNANTRSIVFATGNITLTGNGVTVWNAGNVAGFSYTGTPTINLTYSGSTGTRTISSGSASGSEARALSFNITAGSDIVTFGSNNNIRSVNFTGFAGTFSNTALLIYGDYTISSGMTVTAGASVITFAATSGTQQITTASKTLNMPITFNGVGGTFAFQDALTQGSTRAFTITNGTVQLKASATSTVGAFATSGTNQKSLQSTVAGTQATLSQASGTVSTNYLTIRDINATGGATWNSLWSNNNVDAGDNTGWVFGDPPITLATEYTYALRSFTQPRRF